MKEIKVGYEFIRLNKYGNSQRGLWPDNRYIVVGAFGGLFRISRGEYYIDAPYTEKELNSGGLTVWLTALDYYLCDGCMK